MHQNPRRVSQTCPKFDLPLEQAFVSNKNDQKTLKTNFLTLVGPHFSCFFVFYTHYAKDHLPSQTGQRKSSQVKMEKDVPRNA